MSVRSRILVLGAIFAALLQIAALPSPPWRSLRPGTIAEIGQPMRQRPRPPPKQNNREPRHSQQDAHRRAGPTHAAPHTITSAVRMTLSLRPFPACYRGW